MDKVVNLKVIRVSHKKTNSDINMYNPFVEKVGQNMNKILRSSLSSKKMKLNSSSFSIKDFLQTENNNHQRCVGFDQYQKQIGGLMSEYNLDNQTNKFASSIYDDSSKNLKNLFNHKSKSSTKYPDEGSNINICITTEDFRNHSFAVSVIKKNKIIHDNMKKSFFERQTQKYAETYRDIEHSNINTKLRKIAKSKAKIFSSNLLAHEKVSKFEILSSSIFNNGIAKLTAYYQYPTKSFPECREQFSFSTDGVDYFVFGGNASRLYGDLWDFEPRNLQFNKLTFGSSNSIPRYGHTGTVYQKKLYIFGGKVKMQNFAYLADLDMYSLEDKQWSIPIGYSKSNSKQRKNHIAELVGHQIVFHGGYNENEDITGESFLLNLNPLKWLNLSLSDNKTLLSLAHHTSSLVLPKEIKYHPKLNIYKFPDVPFQKRGRNNIKEKGIYVFGGKRHDGTLSNEMWCMKIGKRPCEWLKCETTGKEPLSRSHHSMNYYEDGNYLIIYGGNHENSECEKSILNDIFLFELSKFEWIEVKLSFTDPKKSVENRCGHSSVIYLNKLIVFGGMNDESYIGSVLFIVSLDSENNGGKIVFNINNTRSVNDIPRITFRGLSESNNLVLPKLK